ncbi:hypothetical protein, partial [Thalassospira xiamenensis]|uniref:hypothetical protein n=1 Tax=Thalassospira xiamenensis TaxID=220697 RepID=UPI003AA7C36F
AKANHALRVLSPDPFVLLTLSLCHNRKNKSRTFSKNPGKSSREKLNATINLYFSIVWAGVL